MTFSADFCILHSFAAGSAKNAPPRSAERHREPNIQRSLVQKGVSAAFLLSQLAAHQHAHDGGHHQAAGPAGRVAEAVQALDVGVEVRVHLDLVGVELQLRAVQQGLVGGEAGDDHVQHLDELDDVGHGAVGHGGGDITGHGILQRGLHVGLCQLLLPCALAIQNIAVALHHDVACAQHIGQLAHLLGVGDGLVEGLGEVVGDEDGEVGVLALLLLEAVAIDHGQVVVIVLLWQFPRHCNNQPYSFLFPEKFLYFYITLNHLPEEVFS